GFSQGGAAERRNVHSEWGKQADVAPAAHGVGDLAALVHSDGKAERPGVQRRLQADRPGPEDRDAARVGFGHRGFRLAWRASGRKSDVETKHVGLTPRRSPEQRAAEVTVYRTCCRRAYRRSSFR